MGNPLKSEGAAFRWLLAVLAGAALVVLVAVLMSRVAAAFLGFILIAVVAVFIVRGMAHMLGSPDEDLVPDDDVVAPGQPGAGESLTGDSGPETVERGDPADG